MHTFSLLASLSSSESRSAEPSNGRALLQMVVDKQHDNGSCVSPQRVSAALEVTLSTRNARIILDKRGRCMAELMAKPQIMHLQEPFQTPSIFTRIKI